MTPPRFAALAATLAMTVLFGGSFVVSKAALAVFTPIQLVCLRFSLSTMAFCALLPWFPPMKADRRTHIQIALLAILEPILYFLVEATGLQRTTATTAAILVATIPLFVLGMEAFWAGVRVKPVEVLLVGVSISGIALLVTAGGQGGASRGTLAGNLLVLAASVVAAAYTVLIKCVLAKVDALTVSRLQSAYAALFFLPFALLEWSRNGIPPFGAATVAQVAYLGLGCSFLAYWLLNYALSYARAGFVSAYTNLIPLIAAGLAVTFLGERITPRQLAGGAITLACLGALTAIHHRAAPHST